MKRMSGILTLLGVAWGWNTAITRCGTNWCINGDVINAKSKAEGLLLNSRMIQGIFDDENSSTVHNWAYPDTNQWDPDRNVAEFTGNMSSYAGFGLNGFTVGFMGGGPIAGKFPMDQPWISSAFEMDGTMKEAWTSRMERVIREADNNGLVVVVQFFYHGQSYRLAPTNEAAFAAMTNAVHWLVSIGKPSNVIIDVCNECNVNYLQPVLSGDNIHLGIAHVQQTASSLAYSLPVSTSFTGNYVPPNSTIEVANFILIHCNNETPQETTAHVQRVRATPAYQKDPKPIVFNECSTDLQVFEAAISAKAGWGFYDQGSSNYSAGYQSPPVAWSPTATTTKSSFFELVKTLSN